MEHYLMNGMIMFEILVASVLGMWMFLGALSVFFAVWWWNKNS